MGHGQENPTDQEQILGDGLGKGDRPPVELSLVLVAPFFLWGTAMVAMKGVIPHTTPMFLAGMRLVPAGLLVLLFCLWQGRAQPKTWQAWLWILGFAGVDGALFQGFLAEGLVRTGAGLGSVMIDSQPLVVAVLARWLFGECIGPWGWGGLAIGALGIGVLGLSAGILPDGGAFEGLTGLFLLDDGLGFMALAALSMAVGTVMMRCMARQVDPVVATGWHMVLGGLPLWGLSLRWEDGQWLQLGGWDWLALTYCAVFGGAIAYGIFFYFAAQGNLTSLSALTFFTPVFALLFGHLFLSEALAPWQWVGVCLALLSIYFVNQREVFSKKPWREWLWYGISNWVGLALTDIGQRFGRGNPNPVEVTVEVTDEE